KGPSTAAIQQATTRTALRSIAFSVLRLRRRSPAQHLRDAVCPNSPELLHGSIVIGGHSGAIDNEGRPHASQPESLAQSLRVPLRAPPPHSRRHSRYPEPYGTAPHRLLHSHFPTGRAVLRSQSAARSLPVRAGAQCRRG